MAHFVTKQNLFSRCVSRCFFSLANVCFLIVPVYFAQAQQASTGSNIATLTSSTVQKNGEKTGEQENLKLSKFAEDVVLHVVLHELGHGLVREFDLPILSNEETLADAFATHYLTSHMPDRALDVLTARVTSLMIEAKEVPRAQWPVSGEHNNDARRAYQIAALAVAADREKFLPVAKAAGMTADNIRNAADYGTEIHRSWRRILKPLMMPKNVPSGEARVRFDANGKTVQQIQTSSIAKEVESIAKTFDWHSQVTIFFIEGDGGAGWNRSRRTITVYSQYVERFIKQGASLAK